jgi:hypothetical protein
MIATLAHPETATEVWRNPATRATRTLRHWTKRKGGRMVHRIAIDYPALEQTFPDVRRFEDVREARAAWKELRRGFSCCGFERV